MQRVASVHSDDRRNVALTVVASALVAFGVAYVFVLTQPRLVASATGFLRDEMLPFSAHWLAPICVAAVAVGVSGLGVYACNGFVRGVLRAPYLWLGPLVVGLSAAVLTGAPAEMPIEGLNPVAVAVPTLLLALGGGALFRERGRVLMVTGALLWFSPAVLLGLAFVAHAGWDPARVALGVEQWIFVSMLLVAWVCLGVMAVVAPGRREDTARSGPSRQTVRGLMANLAETKARARDGARRSAELEAVNGQLEAAKEQLERSLQASELRAQAAELRAQAAEADAVAMRPKSVGWLLVVAVAGVVLALSAAGAYFGVHLPMQRRLAAATGISKEASHNYETQLGALRAELEAQREKSAQVQIVAEHQGAALAECRAQGEQKESAAAAAEPPPKPAVKPKARPKKRAVRRAPKRKPRPATRPKASAGDSFIPAGDDPIAGIE